MGKVHSLYSRLDQKATIENADALLSDYGHRRARAQRWRLAGLQSPNMDGMPKSPSVDNHVEAQVINGLDDEYYLKLVDAVLKALECERYRVILDLVYIHPLATQEAVAERLNLEHSQYYRERDNALIAFAEWWPPVSKSELLVYR